VDVCKFEIVDLINYLGAKHQWYQRNNSPRFPDFQCSFLICESVTKKIEAKLRGIRLKRLKIKKISWLCPFDK
jgi:hypothetical protein